MSDNGIEGETDTKKSCEGEETKNQTDESDWIIELDANGEIKDEKATKASVNEDDAINEILWIKLEPDEGDENVVHEPQSVGEVKQEPVGSEEEQSVNSRDCAKKNSEPSDDDWYGSDSDKDSDWEATKKPPKKKKQRKKRHKPAERGRAKKSLDDEEKSFQAFLRRSFPELRNKLKPTGSQDFLIYPHIASLENECYVCGQRFKDSFLFQSHLRHHPNRELSGCRQCGKIMFRKKCSVCH